MKEIKNVDGDILQQRATALASVCEVIADLKDEQKEVNADFKKRIEALQKERARLARIIKTRQEEIEVEPPLLSLATAANNEQESKR